MTTFPCRSDDFCLEHGYEHMRSSLGTPVCFCEACEREAEKAPIAEGEEAAARACTCHPDDKPPVPCARRYALSECKAATPSSLGKERA
jgi:hypothetical protein